MDTTQIEKQIKDIEDEIFNTQKNKATERHIGKLKAKLAKLRAEVDKRKSASVKGKGFAITGIILSILMFLAEIYMIFFGLS